MKKTTKILSVFMALVMVLACIPMNAFAEGRDTSSLDKYLSNENLAEVVEDLLTDLGDRKEKIVPSILNICFQVIPDMKEMAEAEGIDVMAAETEELADVLVAYVDEMLAEANLNDAIKDFSWIGTLLGGAKIDLNSIDGIFATLVTVIDFIDKSGEKTWGDLTLLNNEDIVKKDGRKTVAMSTENSTGLEIVYALFGFISNEDTVELLQTVVAGELDIGNMNGTISGFAGLDLEATVNDMMGELDVMINEMLYDALLAGDSEVAYADSAYVNYTSDELLAAALLKLMSGADATQDEAKELAGMTLYEILAEYADGVIATFALDFLNNDLKGYINDLIAMDKQLEVLNTIINMDYEFTDKTFNFKDMINNQGGLFENLNNMVCTLVEVLVQPAVYKELALVPGGNENITANLTSFFGYLLKTLASNNGGKLEFTVDDTAYSFDFSEFTADKIAGKSLEDMLVAVVGLFYPTLLQMELPAEVASLEQLVGYTAYVCIDKFMVQEDSVDFDTDYSALVLADGKVKDLSQAQWNNVLGEMGMDVAIYWLNDATNFGMSEADVAAYKADGWTWEDFLEDIVDWALNYIAGLPAVADHLTTERGVSDGSAWYKLNVVFNELFPLAFINGCGDETFTVDTYNAIMETLIPSLYDCDFAAFADILSTNEREDNPFNQPVIASVLGIVDNLLFSLFEHECEDEDSFKKAATATHDGYEGTYCVENGHYIDVEVLPATGETETTTQEKPSETTTQEKPSETTTQDPGPSTVLKGDANLDGKVNAMDARTALRASSKIETLEGDAFKAADVDGNGKITAMDARAILRHSAKVELFD